MLKINKLSCGYGSLTVVHELDLNVSEGSIHALVGANGAGKSTTLMTIAGHVQVKSGSIMIGSEQLDQVPTKERVRRGVALVPEGRRLFSDLTVRDNLEVGGYSLPKENISRNLERVLTMFPRLGERIKQESGLLSGGEQQMLAIGRALMAEPKLLLLDELSLGLMPRMVEDCYIALQQLQSEGMTILLVEQNTQQALSAADDVTVLESGTVAWQGTAEKARQDSSIIEAYIGLRREPKTD
ncbi:MAG: ABC transporter ATP-binding protein [Deltaproteobacteria bacterium]|jgi:branched-chain amino acid transport system ATP-binding protein|nr:ABC transporter ATP-binding protein [Deltaproteobacteria bacterium]MBT4068785.1 ABC transporter ATP-binding protein [Candidatus Neomarinimicrobiota bacterium]